MTTSKHQGSNEYIVKAKKEAHKRAWSKEEEVVLLAGLKALVAQGWKSDNGFRYNYMIRLESAIRNKWPNTDIKAKPHIESKIGAWKRTYAALTDLLGRSGVGFNLHGNNKIDCDDAVWAEICRQNDKIKNWRKSSWDYYEDWKIVFGKDRANGEGAASYAEMLADYKVGDENLSTHERPDRAAAHIDMDEENVGESVGVDDSVANSSYVNVKLAKGKNKRRFEDSMSNLVDIVDEMEKTNKAKLEAVTEGFAKQKKNKQERDDMWALLENLEGFSLEDQFEAAEQMLQSPVSLELFMKLSHGARPAYVRRILRRSGV